LRRKAERHLTRDPDRPDAGAAITKPAEMTWRDYLVLLLRIGAEIEHALMVEYLYAAYSLGGERVPAAAWSTVQRWQSTMLTVAREEMGHLLTVQNLLCLLGAPINLEREDYPWDSRFYPFEFTLEPLGIDLLSRFIFAEMPMKMPASAADWEIDVYNAVAAQFPYRPGQPHFHHVAKIYSEIIAILGDASRVPDSAFLPHTFSQQAAWDEWGKGYRPPPEADAPGQPGDPEPPTSLESRVAHVMVERMGTRTEALLALRNLAGQGEAPELRTASQDNAGEPSHFTRFAAIYRDWNAMGKAFAPAREVPRNPTTFAEAARAGQGTFIEADTSRRWAHLFNLRYRMLLTYLAHTYRLGRASPDREPTPRGPAMHRVFAEMYNLKAIAGILVRLPLAAPADPRRAGPCFEMPYSLALPDDEEDCWRLHADLLASALHLGGEILPDAPPEGQAYLAGLRDLDQQAMAWIRGLLAGSRSRRNR
jgi:hypothetical protein